MWPRRKYRSVEVLSGGKLEAVEQHPRHLQSTSASSLDHPGTSSGKPSPSESANARKARESDRSYHAPPRPPHQLILAIDSELSAELYSAARARDQKTGEFITELLARGLNHEAQRARAQAILEDLTPRERQVVWMTGRGRTNRQIGEALVISPETVKTHLRHALGKLGLRSKAELRLLLLDLGIRWWDRNPNIG